MDGRMKVGAWITAADRQREGHTKRKNDRPDQARPDKAKAIQHRNHEKQMSQKKQKRQNRQERQTRQMRPRQRERVRERE